jgi:osmoprotectant transport system permease protein
MLDRSTWWVGAALVALGASVVGQQDPVRIGSKNFTESAVLAELIAQVLEERAGLSVERKIGLGGTMICWEALLSGEIDVYAEYTGTAWAVLLGDSSETPTPLSTYFDVRRRCRDRFDVAWLEPFGFDNTYALAMREDVAERLGVTAISDLVGRESGVRAGFSVEFSNRSDGFPGLAAAYGLELEPVTLEHGLAYEAVASSAVDLIDAYSTDGKLLKHRLRVLRDDRGFFPPYHAAPIVRGEALRARPEIGEALEVIAGRIDGKTAQALNHAVEAGEQSAAAVARAFLEREGIVDGEREFAAASRQFLDQVFVAGVAPQKAVGPARWAQRTSRLPRLAFEHLALTLLSVGLAVLVAIPLGVAMTRRPRLARVGLGFAGVVQTIPSLALLAFMIPWLGLDASAAIAALFLYALLPILRNTYAGIRGVDPSLVDAAKGLGMRPVQVLRHVELPLAMGTIVAGVRIATVVGIGVATLAAFLGAGGLGEPIVEGLYLNDSALILTGAVPAAALALCVDAGLGAMERRLPGGSSAATSNGREP